MIFVNHTGRLEIKPRDIIEKFLLVLAPFAPHLCEELWQKLGHGKTLAYEPWPAYSEDLCKENTVELAVQVQGKIKDKITVDAGATDEQIQTAALASEKVQAALEGKTPKKIIVIKSRLVNIVV
jgi:leucyl-tRNA synthetase